MSAAFEARVDSAAAAALSQRIRRLASGLKDTGPLMDSLAAELESQARRRIESGGPAPDGAAWQSWSADYAETRRGGQSVLRDEGGLLDSLQSESSPEFARAGSNMVYAALHQFGGEPVGIDVPARPYLGIAEGSEDERDLQAIVDLWAGQALQEALRP